MLRLKLPVRVAFVLCFWLLARASSQGQVVINEIHYDPDVKTELVEFVELFNAGSNAVNLTGWRLTDGIEFTFPNGTSIAPGGYLVAGQNPTAIQTKFGVTALGPWSGRLSSEGETVKLENAAGGKEDEVSYQLGFPWPTVGDAPGHSIELAHPQFDNDLGGNWRGAPAANALPQTFELINAGSTWRYVKGPSEASDPTTAWRALNFNDNAWNSGATTIGYGENGMATVLSDMEDNYVTVFLRQKFVVANVSEIKALVLEAIYDDGFKVWINGNPVLDANMPQGEVAATTTASSVSRESLEFATFNLTSAHTHLVNGTNIIAIQAANGNISSSDFFLNVRLKASLGSPGGPTPGRMNFAFTNNVPPQLRQVNHSPEQPTTGTPVIVSVKATDPEGVSSVSLQYQLVTPGNYIELTDPAYTNNWTTLVMNDAGTGGDVTAGDSIYTVTIPGNLQQHRRLMRYRITATDATGRSIRAPYVDDPQPNFAYFCYDGVPAWQGAAQPGVTPVLDFSTNLMRRLPVVHLIAQEGAVFDATWGSRYGGDLYQWQGALVYDGKVYDHIRYRARGGVWRYAMTKNMWKFDLNRGHDLEMRDDYGRKYSVGWKKLNLGACIQQGNFGHRGEQGMFESVGFRFFNLAGVESPYTTFLQFRIIDDAAEATGSQFEGDFWGLYLGIEQEDGQFLEEHDLADGNLYKMEGGTGELNNLGPLGPTDKSDLNTFLSTYNNTTPTDDWWRTNLDLQRYYSYRTIVEGIHHYDIGDGKNYFYYRDPTDWRWSVHSWDLDLTWANNMYGSGAEPFRDRVLPRTAFNIEYDNRIREIRDLLFNTDQGFQLIDECAWLVRGPTNGPTFLDADRAMWDFNPKMDDPNYSSAPQKAGTGLYYQWPYSPTVSKDFNGCIQLMRNYIVNRSSTLDSLANDAAIPGKPTLTYLGATNFPLNALSFRSSIYSSSTEFGAMKWRVAEVRDTNAPAYDPTEPWPYEINAKWESAELTSFNTDMTLPADALKPGHAYRVRVRMKDIMGRWSHWSNPIQFVCGAPENAALLASSLRISELMFHPPDGSDFEFVELHNTSTNQSLDLAGAAFTSGITFTFPSGATLAPGGYLLAIRNANVSAFRAHYGLGTNTAIFGPYSGSLANEGESVTLKTAANGTEIFDFEFATTGLWPVAAAGAGHSLVPLNAAASGQATGALDYPGNWRASVYRKGSPGSADPEPLSATVLLNEIVAHTDYDDPSRPEYDSDDWIELFNPTGTNVALNSNWYLSDDPDELTKWALPSVIIPARGWLTFSEVTNFHNPITSGFGLDKAGEQVLLSYLPGNGQDRVVDAVRFQGQDNEASLARYVDGSAFWFGSPRTRNTANTTPFTGVRLSEIMYRPPDLGTNDNARDEFIELVNPAASAVSLQDSNGVWRLGGGVAFTFPTNTTLAPGGVLLVVSFNPSDAATSNQFRAAYGIAGGSLRLAGPYSGKLGNRSDRVSLERPQLPDAPGDNFSWIVIDEITYGNQNPWPSSASGTGESLQRRSISRHGNDPENWYAGTATPADARSDRDNDGLPNDWELDHSLNPDDAGDAADDSDLDGLTNLQEFLCGTDPWNAASTFRFDSVTRISGGAELSFMAAANRTYTIQSRTALGAGNWQTWTNISAAPAQRIISIPLNSTDAARYYRLVTPGL